MPMKPHAFTCHCGWTYVRIDKKLWWGPFFNAPISAQQQNGTTPVYIGSLMSMEQFKMGYGDCYRDYETQKMAHNQVDG